MATYQMGFLGVGNMGGALAEAAAQSEEADSAEDAAETAEPEVTAEAVQ